LLLCSMMVVRLAVCIGFVAQYTRFAHAGGVNSSVGGCEDAVGGGNDVSIISYNLYWWCVSDEYGNCPQFANGEGWRILYANLNKNHPFDLMGLQECDKPEQIVQNSGYAGCMGYSGIADAALAWNTGKFTQLDKPGSAVVARDQYGDRYIQWVRLKVKTTGSTIFFANTHGPLGQCNGEAGERLAANYINAIKANKQPKTT